MDKSAIQQIQESANAHLFIKQLDDKAVYPVAALPESFQLMELEKYQPYRNAFRGKFTTQFIEQFIEYHKVNKASEPQCFIDSDSMTAITIFDLKVGEKAGHCNHKAALSLKKTSAFKALLEVDGKKMSQKTLSEWVEDHASELEIYSTTGDKIEIATASAAIRNMKVEAKAGRESSVDDFSHHQSEYESIAVRTKDEYPMPASFKYTCVPYYGLEDRTFEMRMSMIGNEVLILRIRKIEEHEEQMSDEFLKKLMRYFDEEHIEIKSFIGSFS
jgi:uncharacterized protein YfdQ (DUF2303 family)